MSNTDDEIRQMANSYDGVPNDVFDRWLEAHDREVAEKAWGEGARFVLDTGWVDGDDTAPNPYRVQP